MVDDVESHDGREQALLDYIYAHPSLPEMRGSPSAILAAIDEFAGTHEFLINIGADKGRIVADLIAEEKPSVFVELGGYIGYSTILFTGAMQKARAGTRAGIQRQEGKEEEEGEGQKLRYFSLESDPLCASIATRLISLAGLSDIITIVIGRAEDSLRRLHAKGSLTRLDMLFLDHVEDLYVADSRVCEGLGLLRTGALVVADNVVRPGAPEYREYVRGHEGLRSWGVKGLIWPGGWEDELEVTRVLKDLH